MIRDEGRLRYIEEIKKGRKCSRALINGGLYY